MIKHYLSLSLKVFARRKFFTFVSLFGISFTLIVLMLVSALVDHAVAPFPPEVHQDRTVGIYFASMAGEHMRRNGGAGFKLLDGYMRDLPGVERMSIVSYPNGAMLLTLNYTVRQLVLCSDWDGHQGLHTSPGPELGAAWTPRPLMRTRLRSQDGNTGRNPVRGASG